MLYVFMNWIELCELLCNDSHRGTKKQAHPRERLFIGPVNAELSCDWLMALPNGYIP